MGPGREVGVSKAPEPSPVLEIFETGTGENRIEVMVSTGHFDFTIENPWAGSSDTGFGHETHVGLTTDQARSLWEWLGSHLSASAP